MKKVCICVLVFCVIISASACTAMEQIVSPSAPEELVFTIDGYDLQLTADTDFRESTGGSYDIQITNDSCFISVMAFRYIDLPQDTTPLDVYNLQNEDLLSRRENTVVVEQAKTQAEETRTIIRTLYSAERSGSKNYYGSYLIDFPAAETFVWILVSAVPSYFQNNDAYLHEIVTSLTTIS